MDVDIQVRGDRQAEALLDRIADRVKTPRQGLERTLRILERGEQQVFASRGGTIGTAWEARRRPQTGPATLRDTGRLYNSLTKRSAPGAVRAVKGDTARFGTNVFYARVLAKRRPMVGASQATRGQVADEMADYILGR